MPLLEVTGLSKRFGGFVALDGIDLAVAEGERVGLIGPNGSGKSTLVNCICGTLRNETGSVSFAGEGLDGLTALINWVENGTAPAAIVATQMRDGKVARSRPLCPYPQVARYSGNGSNDDAANFACKAPD